MTQHTASVPSFGTSSRRPVLQGIDHGYVERPAHGAGFALWKWFPWAILQRGGSVTRDDERAYRDLQAVSDHSDGE
ncbi:hypothetical protein [Humibacter antri]